MRNRNETFPFTTQWLETFFKYSKQDQDIIYTFGESPYTFFGFRILR